jgi:flagellar assembly factor FliW
LPGFEANKTFRLTESQTQAPLLFMESVSAPDLTFLLLPVALVDPQYDATLSPDDLGILGSEQDSPLLCLAILTVADELPPTANLLAPVVVNPQTGRAVQAIRSDTRYSHQHPLLVPEAAC